MTINRYKIKSDTVQWIVAEIKTPKPKDGEAQGEDYDSNLTYHANLGQAAQSLLGRLVREEVQEGQDDLKSLLAAIERAEQGVAAVVRGMKINPPNG